MKGKLFLIVVMLAVMLSGWVPGATLQPAQAAENDTLSLLIINKTGETIQLTLVGPATYTFTLQAGKSTQQVLPGKYKYQYFACQGKKTGTFTISKDGKKLLLASCSKNQKSKLARVKIDNRTGGFVWLNLVGPATYQFSLKPGKSEIWVIKGKYTYTAFGCGGASVSGTRKLNSGMLWSWYCY